MILHSARRLLNDHDSRVKHGPSLREVVNLKSCLADCKHRTLALSRHPKEFRKGLCWQTALAAGLKCIQNLNGLRLFFWFAAIVRVHQHVGINEDCAHSDSRVPRRAQRASSGGLAW